MKKLTLSLLLITTSLLAQTKQKRAGYHTFKVNSDINTFTIYRNGVKCSNPTIFKFGDAMNIYIVKEKTPKATVVVEIDGIELRECRIKRRSKIEVLTYKD